MCLRPALPATRDSCGSLLRTTIARQFRQLAPESALLQGHQLLPGASAEWHCWRGRRQLLEGSAVGAVAPVAGPAQLQPAGKRCPARAACRVCQLQVSAANLVLTSSAAAATLRCTVWMHADVCPPCTSNQFTISSVHYPAQQPPSSTGTNPWLHCHRYLLALDGYTASSRLGSLLPINSAVLKQQSQWLEWYAALAKLQRGCTPAML